MERGTERMARDTARMEFSADRRTELAANRTMFAAERTYAAWVRTGLVAMASGVGAKPALSGLLPNWLIGLTGTVLVLFSVFCFAAAVWRPALSRPAAAGARCQALLHPALLWCCSIGFLALVVAFAVPDRVISGLLGRPSYRPSKRRDIRAWRPQPTRGVACARAPWFPASAMRPNTAPRSTDVAPG